MKNTSLLIIIFSFLSTSLQAQDTKCCVFVGTSRTENTNCQPPMMYTAIATESEEECKTANKQFRLEHPNYDAAYCYENNMSVIVITYTWKKCSHKGISQIYESTLEKCKETLRQRVDAGYYNYDYQVIYQWGDNTYVKATSEYINDILVDFYVHKKTGKVVRLVFHNKKEKEAKVYIIQPSGDHKRILVPPGDISIGQVFESGTRIKISFDDYNVFDKDKGKKEDWWDVDIIEKLKGEVRKLVTDPNKKNIIVEPCTTMGIRG